MGQNLFASYIWGNTPRLGTAEWRVATGLAPAIRPAADLQLVLVLHIVSTHGVNGSASGLPTNCLNSCATQPTSPTKIYSWQCTDMRNQLAVSSLASFVPHVGVVLTYCDAPDGHCAYPLLKTPSRSFCVNFWLLLCVKLNRCSIKAWMPAKNYRK